MADSTKQFLVIDENGAGHLKVRNSPDGPLDHNLLGAAWAALHQGYRGNKYEGPDKGKAIAKLKRMYEEENMPMPGMASDDAAEHGPMILLDELPAPTERGGKKFYELPVLLAGKWERFEVSKAQLSEMERNFAVRMNGMLNVDYEHASEMPEVAAGGPVPAAGWIHKLASRQSAVGSRQKDEVLMGSFEFTPRAEQMIRDGEYRFLSPAFRLQSRDKKTGANRGAALLSVGLTNKPYLEELPAIKLSEITGLGDPRLRGDDGHPRAGGEPEQIPASAGMTGGTMAEKLVARPGENGRLEILKGTEVVGFIELEKQVDEKPIFAAFSERIGAKGKTEGEIKTLVESAGKFLARETREAANTLLASECVKDGKLDRERMKVLARESKVGMEDFLAFEDGFAAVDEAVKAGKVLPKDRDYFLKIALSDVAGFKKFSEKAPKVIALNVAGLAGGRTRASKPEQPVRVTGGKVVVNADRVARIREMQSESSKQGKKLEYVEAQRIVLSEEAQAGIDGDGQAAE